LTASSTAIRDEEGALIPVLQEAQEIYGYLPEEVLAAIGKRLHIPMSRIYGVITFYAQFYLTPRGAILFGCVEEPLATFEEGDIS